ncbi:GPW/gp25 family protein [Tenacibaculum tangerinum]|uniref:GPW/gp25 family protein n=1 Tax=Tenacibaculum tangerinum TaxID=3038772 RepID=A0ABY8L3N7_9FLAO|nr:GPW/gp25 family protein [Tenacibaculum tangerinum]WGH75706.1 GPW/gp25 family protein [Tenacibaculum tangerinum]
MTKEFLGSGWAFPVTFSEGNYELRITKYEANIEDSIDIIMQTNFGEHPMKPDFGSGLQRFFFKKMNKALKADIEETVRSSLLQNEPRITVKNVEVVYKDLQTGLVEITVDYVYNQTNTRHNYVYPFHLKEGTNLLT